MIFPALLQGTHGDQSAVPATQSSAASSPVHCVDLLPFPELYLRTTKTRKGCTALKHGDITYILRRKNKSAIVWQCQNLKCNAKITTTFNYQVLSISGNHDHKNVSLKSSSVPSLKKLTNSAVIPAPTIQQ